MKKQNKFYIPILFTGLAVSVASLYQRILFLFAAKKATPSKQLHQYYWSHGKVVYDCKGSGRPLLLLHNTQIGASHKEWEKVLDSLAKHYTVFAVDLPGFGASEKPKITYTAYQYTLFINHFIEQVIKMPTIVIASSLSADFAIMACHMKQENFKKLVLISPTGIHTKSATNADARLQRLLQSPIAGTQLYIKKASKKAIAHMLRHESFFAQEQVTKDLIESYYYAAHCGGESARFSYASAASNFLNTQITEAFRSIGTPFLVIWGKENKSNSITNLSAIQNLRQNGQYALFENTRMLPHYENSDAFIDAVNRFL